MAEELSVATWNVNSVRARLPHLLDWLRSARPDVLALQELKVAAEEFPAAAFEELGYAALVNGQKTYNGVALLSRRPLEAPQAGLAEHEGDPQARVVAATVAGVRIVDVYVPNGQERGSEKFAYKLRWLDGLAQALAGRPADEPLVVLGDFNIAPEARDIHDPAYYAETILFTDEERAALRRLLDLGLVDLFRRFHDEPKLYSWWDYRMNAFRRNLGARIDLLLATPSLAERALSCDVDRAPRALEKPSDHAPVVARFRLA